MENVVRLFNRRENLSIHGYKSFSVQFEIVGVIDSYKNTQNVYVTVQVKGTSKTFVKSVKELYQKKWLNKFSREDVAYIGFLYAAEESENLPLIDYFPRRKTTLTKNVILLGMLFLAFLILSNMTAFKIVKIQLLGFSINFPAALIFFPLTYLFDDTLTEVYGFKVSRLIIWGGLCSSAIFTIGAWATVYLPASPLWDANTNHGEKAYELIFKGSPRIFIASATGYFCGEFLNSIVLAKLKILTFGKYFCLRVVGSTLIGVGVDSIIFCNIAFWDILPPAVIGGIIFTQYIFKLSYEIVMLPITYLLTNALKKWDKIDYYDFQTSFNPFSLKLVD